LFISKDGGETWNLNNLISLGIQNNNIPGKLLKKLQDGKDPKLLIEYCRMNKGLDPRFNIQKIMDREGKPYFCPKCNRNHIRGKFYREHIDLIH